MGKGLVSGRFYDGLGFGVEFANLVQENGEDYYYTRDKADGRFVKSKVYFSAKGEPFILKRRRRIYLRDVLREGI